MNDYQLVWLLVKNKLINNLNYKPIGIFTHFAIKV